MHKTLGQLVQEATEAWQQSVASLSMEMQFDLRRLWRLAEALRDVDDLIKDPMVALAESGHTATEAEEKDYKN